MGLAAGAVEGGRRGGGRDARVRRARGEVAEGDGVGVGVEVGRVV